MIFFLLVLCLATSSSWAKANPNVLIIYTDDQGYGDVSYLNPDSKIQTSNIDRLISEGINFTHGELIIIDLPIAVDIRFWETCREEAVIASDYGVTEDLAAFPANDGAYRKALEESFMEGVVRFTLCIVFRNTDVRCTIRSDEID